MQKINCIVQIRCKKTEEFNIMENRGIQAVLIGGDKGLYKWLEKRFETFKNSSYRLLWSASYKGGINYAHKNQPDVFLVNFENGDSRALDFISEIRKRDCVKPVILMAKKADVLSEKKAKKAGAEFYLENYLENPALFEKSILETVERAKALEAIRKSESRMRGIFYGASIGIALIDMERNIVQGNPSLCRIIGYDAEQICAMDLADDFAHPHDLEKVKDAFRELTDKTITLACIDCRFQCKQGTWVWVQLTLSLFAETDMPPQFVIGLIDDISEKKRAQLALRKSEAQLRELSMELVRSEEKERNRISMELHDSIGSSLAGIKYMIEKIRIQKDRTPEGYLNAIDRLETQVIDVMDEVNRIAGELYPRILSDLGLLPAIRWLVKNLAGIYSDIEMVTDIGTTEPQINDELKIFIFRLLQETLNNAVKHSGANRIDVIIKKTAQGISILIKDNGSGFSTDILKEPWERKGMGLRNMIKRVELSGGLMRIESPKNEGTRIYVEWSFPIGV